MAGIGFVLERILKRRGVGGLLFVAAVGTMLVAGPWLVSIATISLSVFFVPAAIAATFQQIVLVTFSFSLVVFGGLHLLVTRHSADLVYVRAGDEIVRYFLRSIARTVAIALPLGIGISWLVLPATELLFVRLLLIAIVVLVNVGFIQMIFASQNNRFFRMLVVYGIGGVVTVGGAYLFADSLAGILSAFAAGFGVIVVGLAVTAAPRSPTRGFRRRAGARAFRARESSGRNGHRRRRRGRAGDGSALPEAADAPVPEEVSAGYATDVSTPRVQSPTENRSTRIPGPAPGERLRIAASGALLYLLLWSDKFVYWFAFGDLSGGGSMPSFAPYDTAAFAGQLALIPGLVFYLVAFETDYFRNLRKTLRAMVSQSYRTIQESKYELKRIHWLGFARQMVFQYVFVAILLFLMPTVSTLLYGGPDGAPTLIRVTLCTSSYLGFYTLFINLLYLRRYRDAFISVSVAVLVDLLATFLTALAGATTMTGVSFFLGCAAGTIMCARLLNAAIDDLDRHVMTYTS